MRPRISRDDRVPVIVQIAPIGAAVFTSERFIHSITGVYGVLCRVDPVDTQACADTLENIKKGFNIDKFGSFQHPVAGGSASYGIETSPYSPHIAPPSTRSPGCSACEAPEEGKEEGMSGLPGRMTQESPLTRLWAVRRPSSAFRKSASPLSHSRCSAPLLSSRVDAAQANPLPGLARSHPAPQSIQVVDLKRVSGTPHPSFDRVSGYAQPPAAASPFESTRNQADSGARLPSPVLGPRQLTRKRSSQLPLFPIGPATPARSQVVADMSQLMRISRRRLLNAAQPLQYWMGEGWDHSNCARSCGVLEVPGDEEHGRPGRCDATLESPGTGTVREEKAQ